MNCLVLSFFSIGRDSNEALGNEFGFFLTSLGGKSLLHHLSTAGSLASSLLEFAHVFTVTDTLFLLGVCPA